MNKLLCLVAVLCLNACSYIMVPDGYRMNKYKAPVPSLVPGGETISVEKAVELKKQGVVFLDVVGSGKYLTKGIENEWLVVKPNLSIPGSLWLPDVGRGALNEKQESYFKESLNKVTNGQLEQPLVLFCLQDCWMSWNATKRAASYGYKNLYWLPDGKDGWAAKGHKLERIAPFQ